MDSLSSSPSSSPHPMDDTLMPVPAPISFSELIYKSIPFQNYIFPFTQMLMGATENFLSSIFKVLSVGIRCVSALDVVVHRLLYAPSFDPTHPSFKKLIDRLDAQVPFLQKKIDQLEQKIWKDDSFSGDIAEMRVLSDEIARAYAVLSTYDNALENRVHPFPIQAQLNQVRVKFGQLDDQLNEFCLEKGKKIIGEFDDIATFFSKGGKKLTEEIRTELFEAWSNLDRVFNRRLTSLGYTSLQNNLLSNLGKIENLMNTMKNTSKNSQSFIHYNTPLGLSNIGNSCYMDSVLESILCINYMRKKLSYIPEQGEKKPSEYKSAVAIQQEILQFIDDQESPNEEKQLSQMNLILYLMRDGASLYRLRNSIFKSGFHPELEMQSLKSQHDSAFIMELLIDHLLPDCKFYTHEYATTEIFPGLIFPTHGNDVGNSLLQVSLRNREKYQPLAELVRLTLGRQEEKEAEEKYQRLFDPKSGVVIPGNEESLALISDTEPKKVDKFIHWHRLTKLPPVLTIQFKRFSVDSKGHASKDERPVILPEDGILDLSKYYDAPEGESKNARYKIKSMVRHFGGVGGGHYVAAVEINGSYFHCDDTAGYQKISKEDFLDHTDPYLLFLERIPD